MKMKKRSNKGCICQDTCKYYIYKNDIVPRKCPSIVYKNIIQEAKSIYQSESSDARKIWKAFAKLIHTGGAKKSRVEHVIDVCTAMQINKIGIASCLRYIKIAHYLMKLLRKRGFEVHIALCKLGGFKVEDLKINKNTNWIVCNPVAQALLLNALKCELNITLGLCMGQDLIFNKYSKGFVTNLIVKEKISNDRVCETIKTMMKGKYLFKFYNKKSTKK